MHIRLATPSDASKIALVHVESSRSTYRGILPDEVLNTYSYYEALGGQLVQKKSVQRRDKILLERAYGWDNTLSQ